MSNIYKANNTAPSIKTAPKTAAKGEQLYTLEQLTQIVNEQVQAALAKVMTHKPAAKTEYVSVDWNEAGDLGLAVKSKSEFRLERLKQFNPSFNKSTFEHNFTDKVAAEKWVTTENAAIDASIKMYNDADIKASNAVKTPAGLAIKIGFVTRIPSKGETRGKLGKVQAALEGLWNALPDSNNHQMIITPQNFADFVTFGGWAMVVR